MSVDHTRLPHPQAAVVVAAVAIAVADMIATKMATTLQGSISEDLLLMTVASTVAIIGRMETMVEIDTMIVVSHDIMAAEVAMVHLIAAETETIVRSLGMIEMTSMVGVTINTEDVQDLAQVQNRTIGKKVAIMSTQLTRTEGHHLQIGIGTKVESMAVVDIIVVGSVREGNIILLVHLHVVVDLLQTTTMKMGHIHTHMLNNVVAVVGTVAVVATMKVEKGHQVLPLLVVLLHFLLKEVKRERIFIPGTISGSSSSNRSGTVLEMEIGEITEIDLRSTAEEGILMVLLVEEEVVLVVVDMKEVPHPHPGDNYPRPPTVVPV